MTRLTLTQPAGPDEVFAPGCFDSQIGKTAPVTVEGETYGTGTLVAAKVADDGRSAELTFDLDPQST